MHNFSQFNIRKRLLIIVILITFLFAEVFGTLIYLQIFQAEALQVKAAEQWMRDLPLTAKRGLITDRNGVVLADSSTLYDVYIRPNAIEDRSAVANLLATALNTDYDKIWEKVNKTGVSEVTIAKKIEKSVMQQIADKNLAGIYFSQNINRYYVYGDFLTQVLGFTSSDGNGQTGIEQYYNDYLKGVDGKALTETDLVGKELDGSTTTYLPAIDGMNATLTIDYYIQSFAENAVKTALETHNAKSAKCIVMDPNTGEILALASAPSFDLNNLPRDNLELLFGASRNTIISDAYEPGSTFKILTSAIGLDSGNFDLNHSVYCPGYRIVDGQRIKCWRTIGHGSQTFSEGVENSCNCLFMDIAQTVGTRTFYEYLKRFGIGSKTGIDAIGEASGIVIEESAVKTVDLARIGFGQAIAVTPIELITAAASVINGGNLMTPYIMSEITSNAGVAYKNSPIIRNSTVSAETSEIMRRILEGVVKNGGGKNAYVEGYRIGGKTGTAQKYENGVIAQGKYVSSFIGFAPADNPQYIALMIVDEPSNGVYYGSIVAAPYVGEIFKNIFAYKNIEAVYTDEELANLGKKVVMPDLRGLSITQAILKLKELGLQYELDGDIGEISYQFPAPQSEISVNSVVLIKASG